MSIKYELRKFLWRFGFDIIRFEPRSHPLARRKQMLESYNIDVVLDIGANVGQFALQIRDIGYTNKIVSFEPMTSAFKLLKAKAKPDPDWEIFNFALGDAEDKQEINISRNSYSSSLLDMLPAHLESAPESKYIGKEIIEIKKLDTIFSDLCNPSNKVYMKIDTQGFEDKVLKGAENSLRHIHTVQMEMSLVPLYEGAFLFNEVFALMSEKGYTLVAVEPGFSDPDSGQLLQVDGIFHRV